MAWKTTNETTRTKEKDRPWQEARQPPNGATRKYNCPPGRILIIMSCERHRLRVKLIAEGLRDVVRELSTRLDPQLASSRCRARDETPAQDALACQMKHCFGRCEAIVLPER